MKEIGESFKEARETIGISKSEVIKDLNITESQLDNLEDGNANAFKDVFFLKETIKKYAIYLNLNEDEIIDKFNDFIFGYTSRIPINDILEQTKEFKILEKQKEDNKIVSPYTIKRKNNNTKYIIIYFVLLFFLLIVYGETILLSSFCFSNILNSFVCSNMSFIGILEVYPNIKSLNLSIISSSFKFKYIAYFFIVSFKKNTSLNALAFPSSKLSS